MEALEQDILEWIAAHSGDAALAAQLRQPTIRRRDYTRTGIFLHFQADAAMQPVPRGVRARCPAIESLQLPDGAGCSLFLRDGYLHYLEVYARGGFLPPALTDYRLAPGA